MEWPCLTDEEMAARIQQGENDLLEGLIRRYYDDVYRFCFYKTGDREYAYDCTQETFLKLTRYIYTYREQQKFKGYLFSIARNVCNDYFRGRPKEAADWADFPEIPAEGDDYRKRETALLVQQAVSVLVEEQREAVVLRFYYDFKVREIAKIMGVPLPTAKSRLKRGVEKLKKLLEKEGIGYDG